MEPLQQGDPRQVGEFTLEGRLGAGGMGRVFVGRSPGGRRVAVKVIHDWLARDREFRARFAREIAAARKVSGFYTAEVVAADPAATTPWMATRYIDGPSLLHQVQDHGPLPVGRVFEVAAGVAEALAAIHAAGVVHRDLKPSNVVLAADSTQVIDFGIARAAEDSSVTGTGVATGTTGFMSPEQVRGDPVEAPSDVFTFGALVFFAATGRPVFGIGHPATIMHRVLHDEPDLTALTDARLRNLVATCLAKDPDQRPSPAQILTSCEAAFRNAGPREPLDAASPQPGSDPERGGPVPIWPSGAGGSLYRPAASPGETRSGEADDATVPRPLAHSSPDPPTAVRPRTAGPPGYPADGWEPAAPPSRPGPEPGSRDQARPTRWRWAALAAAAVIAVIGGITVLAPARPRNDAAPGHTSANSAPVREQGSPSTSSYVTGDTATSTSNNGSSAVGKSARGARLVGSIPMASEPSGVTLSPDGRRAYVPQLSGNVSVLDTAANTVTATISVAGAPVNIALTPDGGRAYLARWGATSVVVIDTGSNTVSASIEVGAAQWGVALTPDGRRAYVTSRGTGTLSVIDTATNTVTTTIRTSTPTDNPVDIAVSPDGRHAYATNRGSGTVSVIDTQSNTVTGTVSVQGGPNGVAVAPDGRRAYVTNEGSDTISVIDTGTNSVLGAIAVGDAPITVAVAPDSLHAYVVDRGSKAVSVIDATTNRVTAVVSIGGDPGGVMLTRDGRRLYVSNAGAHAISVIDTGE